jgi:hypothetical protein
MVAAVMFTPGIVLAAEGDIGPVLIERIAIIATPTGGHIAGNMEVKIKNGFALPAGVTCDTNFITTRKTTDPDRSMFSELLQAKLTSRPVRLRITNSTQFRAFPGRCSIEIVDLL